MTHSRTSHSSVLRLRLSVAGIVQGVGFRPFVYRLAHELGLGGFVRNTPAGVIIEVEGTPEKLAAFQRGLHEQAPPLARITEVHSEPVSARGETEFRIILSESASERTALIAPDVGTCADCLRELFDPKDRRYFYPFINCTNCGPRYTIVQDIPYDRKNTTMRLFQMCPECEAEYHDPTNRRFHAQPNACHACGPHIWLVKGSGSGAPPPRKPAPEKVISEAAHLVKAGAILAIKGIGGFHLVVDATNDAAVRRLRQRKRREEKALAMMSPDLIAIRRYAHVSTQEEELLTGVQRPIVLLRKKDEMLIAPSVAPRSKYFGVMLPYSPLHHLLMRQSFLALVMTSGNLSEEPIAIDNEEALSRLGEVADYFLLHDRDIHLRADDSVARVDMDRPIILRRSRGYAPAPVRLHFNQPESVLAVGAELKNTVCLTKGQNAFISQHIGDLKNVAECEFFEMTIRHLKTIFQIEPQVIAHDLHPDYRSTRYALAQKGARLIAVQHHHAHIASCLAEHGCDQKVIGLSFDGTGYGTDGRVWGGEFLIADLQGFDRVGHFRYVRMPGGDKAVEEPDRMALAWLYTAFGPEAARLNLDVTRRLGENTVRNLVAMLQGGLNSPETSSVGRLFDAVSALAGICHRCTYEGQPAIELEGVADLDCRDRYDFDIQEGESLVVDMTPAFRAMVKERPARPEIISAKFHNALVAASAEVCERLRQRFGIHTVALSGGVFQNQLLVERLTAHLQSRGFNVLRHQSVPPNDGGIALGQAAVALKRLACRS